MKRFPVIDQPATGENILKLRKERGLTVRDLQNFFGFEEPQAIYKWQRGESLPSVDNLYALGSILEVPMEEILVPKASLTIVKEQQDKACCSDFFCSFYASWRFGHSIALKGFGPFRPRKALALQARSLAAREPLRTDSISYCLIKQRVPGPFSESYYR